MSEISIGRRYLSRKEAAKYLTDQWFCVSKSSLDKYAANQLGPPYKTRGLNGAALYTTQDLDLWAQGALKDPAPK